MAGRLHPPAGRRLSWLLLVPSCPACGGYAHVHRVPGYARRVVKAPSCHPHLLYEVFAELHRPEAVSA